MKIEALNTKVQLLQSNTEIVSTTDKNENKTKSTDGDGDVQLINLSTEPEVKPSNEESTASEIIALNNKIEKMEHLLNKYKESLKVSKEKNSQINTELQILSNELENKNKEIDQYKLASDQLKAAKENIQELNNLNEELQNKINVYEFNKTRELSTLEVDFQKAQEEIAELRGKIEVFGKREEEYAISLAENKLSIHKELESKETEIKSLKDHLESSKKEIQSLNIVVNDYKNSVTSLEAEKSKLMHDSSELASIKAKTTDLESQIEELSKKCQNFEQMKTKADEGYKCLQLQMKQETAEKLAMIDRNTYLENRISQLSEENAKKSAQIGNLESELQKKENILKDHTEQDSKNDELLDELNIWKDKYAKLESEIQEERDELIKLQSEIEKLLSNHELLQTQNIEFRKLVSDLKSENVIMQEKLIRDNKLRTNCLRLSNEIREIKKLINLISSETKSLQAINNEAFFSLTKEINYALHNNSHSEANLNATKLSELKLEIKKLEKEIKSHVEINDQLRKEIDTLQNDKDNLESTISRNDIDIQTINLELTRTIDLYETSAKELNVVKEENENLLNKVNEFENNFQNLQIALEFEKSQYLESKQKLNELQNEKDVLVEKIKHLEFKNNTSNKELDQFKSQHENALEESLALKNENISLKSQIIELNNQIDCINKLQEDNKNLTLENISLKTQAESTANSYKNLETEINDVRKSHAEIVTEKDRLNKTIEELESSLCKDTTNRDSQTDKIEDTMPSNLNNEEVKKVAVLELQETPQRTNKNELSDKYQALKSEYDQLKEENRRFKSDIEGLQTYLTKISKENSVLNDKLRELIATSEHSTESNDISNDIVEFKNEIQAGKDRIDDLLRENMLLVEENLELKDQLQSQNTPSSEVKPSHDNDKEYNIVMEKYNNLLHVNSTLEKRLYDLEQMNKSVNGNMMHIQEKNEKLRLSNEKLERRLDESLVSLRHLHSLQENTELEYLRNILYEYLTGTGTHSVTLAKVLSAIVKFDDMQTKLVLQKEKERQGFVSIVFYCFILEVRIVIGIIK